MSPEYSLCFQRLALNRKALLPPQPLGSFSSLDATNSPIHIDLCGHKSLTIPIPFQGQDRVSLDQLPVGTHLLSPAGMATCMALTASPGPGLPAFLCLGSAKKESAASPRLGSCVWAGRSESGSPSA